MVGTNNSHCTARPVLSPLFILLYINGLLFSEPEYAKVAMFADDVSIFSNHPNKEVIKADMQKATPRVELTFGVNKCEVILFTSNNRSPLTAFTTTIWYPSPHNLITELP